MQKSVLAAKAPSPSRAGLQRGQRAHLCDRGRLPRAHAADAGRRTLAGWRAMPGRVPPVRTLVICGPFGRDSHVAPGGCW